MSEQTRKMRPTQLMRARNMRSESAPRVARALELRSKGLSFSAIAAQNNCSLGSAHRDVARALREVIEPAAEEMRKLEGKRLDAMQSALWATALGGDSTAINSCLRIMQRRATLFGLDATQRVEVIGGVLDQYVASKGWTAQEVVALLDSALSQAAVIEGEIVAG